MPTIYQLPTQLAGTVGIYPNFKYMVTGDNLATITAAGYLNSVNLESYPIQTTDVLCILYGFNPNTNVGTYEQFTVAISNGVITLSQASFAGQVTLPTIANHIATYTNVGGGLSEDAATAINGGNIQAGLSGTAGYLASFPSTASKGSLKVAAVANTGNTVTTISNAAMGQATVVSITDPGVATTNFILADNATGQTISTGNLTLTAGNLVASAGNITATAGAVSAVNLKYGATPVAQADPASCTITAAAGAANTATVTIQLKDGSGTNLTRSMQFRVYASSAADGLTLASAASTGFSVASGGLSLANGTAVTTQITAMSSATGGCVLSLLDTGKQTSYLVLVLPNGNKISAQLSAGSYG